jgi:Cu/Ag efflux protein CusF
MKPMESGSTMTVAGNALAARCTDPVARRRRLLFAMAAIPLAHAMPAIAAPAAVLVFRNPSCGCCGAWIEHLQAAGFSVTVREVSDLAPVRRQLGLQERYASCHTATVGGYVLEGHVPAADLERLLASKPVALGLAVPGMPVGSPGMEVGGQQEAYDVLLVARDGSARVFNHYPHHHGSSHPETAAGRQGTSPAPTRSHGSASSSERTSDRDASAIPLVDGVVRRIDREARKVTLRHGPIPNLEMPEMTMVFQVADPAMLDGLEAASAIRFKAERRNGQLTLTYIEPV